MKVSIKTFDVDMELKTNGVEFEVRKTNNDFLGDIFLTKTGIIWCSGRTRRENGVNKSWEEMIEFFDEDN